MARFQLSSTAVFLLAVCTLFPTVVLGNKKTGIFNKMADTTRDLQGAATTGASALLGAAGAGQFSLDGFMDKFEELADKQWGTPKATLDFDLISLMRDVFVQDKEHTRLLQEAWADPEILRALMEDLPMFDVIKPLRALREKETLTPQDVSKSDERILSVANASGRMKMIERQLGSVILKKTHTSQSTYVRVAAGNGCRAGSQRHHGQSPHLHGEHPRP